MQAAKGFEEKRSDNAKIKHAAKHGMVVSSLTQNVSKVNVPCNNCGSIRAGLTGHSNSQWLPDAEAFLENFICTVRARVRRRASGLTGNIKSRHADQPTVSDRFNMHQLLPQVQINAWSNESPGKTPLGKLETVVINNVWLFKCGWNAFSTL